MKRNRRIFILFMIFFSIVVLSMIILTDNQKETNIALNKFADASSYLDINYSAMKAIDGNRESLWIAANQSFPQTLTIDLRAISDIKYIRQTFQDESTWYYRIEGSFDNAGNGWTVLVDRTRDGVEGQTITETIDTTYRYLRLVVTGSANQAPASSVSFEVIGNVHQQERGIVPPPVPVDTGDKLVIAQSCNLWASEYFWNSLRTEQYPELRPLMGYYNEAFDASTDWQIKMALENGISGFFSCWFREKDNEGKSPILTSFGGLNHSLAYSAEYRDQFMFGIQWENRNDCCSSISGLDDFLNHLVPYWIEEYFSQPNYLNDDGKPIISIYSIARFIEDVGGEGQAKRAISGFREKVKEAGFEDVIILTAQNVSTTSTFEDAKEIGIDYLYNYHIPTFMDTRPRGFELTAKDYVQAHYRTWDNYEKHSHLPYIMTASTGWDARPWGQQAPVWEIPPEDYRILLQEASKRMEQKTGLGARLIFLDNWNEYAEGHFIAPTIKYGFDYLNAVRSVFANTNTEPENVMPRIDSIPQMLRIRTITGVNVFAPNGQYELTQPNERLLLSHQIFPENEEGKYAIKWLLLDEDGISETDRAILNENGLLRARRNGTVIVRVIINNDPDLVSEIPITITGQPETEEKETSKTFTRSPEFNLALGKEATASEFAQFQSGQYDPSKAVDGDLDSFWVVDGVKYPAWLMVDLEEAYDLDAVVQIFADEEVKVYRYVIEGSNDKENWQMLADRSTEAQTGPTVTELVEGRYQYVRLTILGANAWPSSRQLEIYGK